MFKDIISTRKENKKNMMIMLFVGLIIILLSFFINVVFIGLIGLIFIIPSSIISGTSGAVLSTAISTIAVMIATYTNFAELHIVNIVVSLMVYWFIGLMIGRNIDKEKAQTKKIEEMNKELIDTKEEIQKVFEGTQDNMFLIEVIDDETFRFVRNNNAHQKSTGLTVEMIKGKTPIELLGDELGSKIQDNYKKCIEMMTTVTYEEELALPAGTKIWHTSLSPILREGKATHIIGSSQDITDRIAIKTELINKEKRLRSILETTQDGFWIVGEDLRITDVNEAYCQMTGYTRDELLNLKISDLEFYESPEDTRKRTEKILKNGQDSFVTKHIKKNGEIFDVEVSVSCFNQKPIEMICFCRDITSKKIYDELINEMKERVESIIEGTNVGTWVWNIHTGETIFNEKWAGILGYTLEELSPVDITTWERMTHPNDFKLASEELQKVINHEKEYYDFELRMKHKNGHWVWINDRGKVTKWSDEGKALKMSGTHMDITARKDAEEEIYTQREKFRTTLLSVGDAIISTDKNGRIEIMNNVAEALTGWSRNEAYDQPLENVLKLVNEYTRETCANPVEQALRLGITVEMESHTLLISKEGKEIPIEDSAAPIKDKHGRITGAVVVFRDFTEKSMKQKQIEYLSFHDGLTGLYNRRYMEDSINRLDTERSIPFSVIVADINGLKLTNDAYGHEMGDRLIMKVVKILENSCRKDDIICRVGGDEFVVLLPKVDEEMVKDIIKRIAIETKKTKLESVIVSLALGYAIKKHKDKNILDVYKEADNQMYQNKIKHGRNMRNKTIEKVLLNINNKYDNEQIHAERVSQYCESIAKALKLSNKEIIDAKIAGSLHDIGKIAVPSEMLNKKDKLTQEEWEEVKKHSITSYQLLKGVDEYATLAESVLYHHERLDGMGYPEGLKELEIPLLSKIIAVADAYEAMTAKRSYQTIRSKKEAIEELKKYSGTQFDKQIVDVFINEVL